LKEKPAENRKSEPVKFLQSRKSPRCAAERLSGWPVRRAHEAIESTADRP
jgi:hypothetical protein